MTSAILLSGGIGKRASASSPKQYLFLEGKSIILYSLETLINSSLFAQIVIVCEEKYESVFTPYKNTSILFARPGKERQDSVLSGLKALSSETKWVCIHDGARPFLDQKSLEEVILAGKKTGAAALAVPVNMTIKQANKDLTVKKTLDRSSLWDIQTPQVLSYSLLQKGYAKALKENIQVTDDVSLAEICSHPVRLVLGSDDNIKITTPKDLKLATLLAKEHNFA